MVRLTRRVRGAQQPRGGYLNPRTFQVSYVSGVAAVPIDHRVENVHASLVGMAVDYLTRYALADGPGRDAAERSFMVSLIGAEMVGREDYAQALCDFLNEERERANARAETPSDVWVPSLRDAETGEVQELRLVRVPGQEAIDAAVKLASFDSAFRAGLAAYNPDANITPDSITSEHIGTMVARSLAFFREFAPITEAGFIAGDSDGDYLTADTIWDFKVSVSPPTSVHTLQLLALWIMGMHNGQFQSITHLGLYNPRLDAVYRIPVASISEAVIDDVSASGIVG